MAAVYQSLSNTFQRMGNNSSALVNARQALEMFEDVRDLRGVRGTMGVLGELTESVQDWSEAVFYYHGAIRLRDYLGEIETSIGRRDTGANLASLRSIANRIGQREYVRLAEMADSRLRDLFEHLELKGVKDLLVRRDLARL